ncbi:MAG TPA: LuxR C-terminal-related transcriptional regulator [Blastocatellia bacterium]|nr:LuxR C-terminal-related transcriptional regulator [Blastocatellia bacterium]
MSATAATDQPMRSETDSERSKELWGRQLSTVEREIATLVCRGMRNDKIAAVSNMSHQAVEQHLLSICKKLCLDGRLGLIIYAFEHSLAARRNSPQARVDQ